MQIKHKLTCYVALSDVERHALRLVPKKQDILAEIGGFSRETARKLLRGSHIQVKSEKISKLRSYLDEQVNLRNIKRKKMSDQFSLEPEHDVFVHRTPSSWVSSAISIDFTTSARLEQFLNSTDVAEYLGEGVDISLAALLSLFVEKHFSDWIERGLTTEPVGSIVFELRPCWAEKTEKVDVICMMIGQLMEEFDPELRIYIVRQDPPPNYQKRFQSLLKK